MKLVSQNNLPMSLKYSILKICIMIKEQEPYAMPVRKELTVQSISWPDKIRWQKVSSLTLEIKIWLSKIIKRGGTKKPSSIRNKAIFTNRRIKKLIKRWSRIAEMRWPSLWKWRKSNHQSQENDFNTYKKPWNMGNI